MAVERMFDNCRKIEHGVYLSGRKVSNKIRFSGKLGQ